MSAVQIERISQVSVTVNSVERAIAFYRDVLGLPVLFQQRNMALLDCGGVRLILSVPESPEFDHPSSIIYYLVADLQEAHRALVEAGVTVRGEPHRIGRLGATEVWMSFYQDPDGNTLALTSEVAVNG